MTTLANAYLTTARRARDLIATPDVRDRWDQPSVLAEYRVAGLAGHLARSILIVDSYLSSAAPAGATVVDASRYYVEALGDADPITAPLHHAVRTRSADAAAAGAAALVEKADARLRELEIRLDQVTDDDTIIVFGELAVTVHDYLRTRLVELVVHSDDLATSVGLEPPPVTDDVGREVVSLLAEIARVRWGTYAMVHSLARRERAVERAYAF